MFNKINLFYIILIYSCFIILQSITDFNLNITKKKKKKKKKKKII